MPPPPESRVWDGKDAMTWGLRPVSDSPPFHNRKPFCRSRLSLGVARLLARSPTPGPPGPTLTSPPCEVVRQSARKLGYQTHYVIDGGKSRIVLSVLVTPGEASSCSGRGLFRIASRTLGNELYWPRFSQRRCDDVCDGPDPNEISSVGAGSTVRESEMGDGRPR
jgi:hypothetical protein